MNLSRANSILIDGKEINELYIDGELVYQNGIRLRLSSDKEYILTDETAIISIQASEKEKVTFELFKVINMVRTSLGTLTTDENGQATYIYTGVGDGEIGFLAKYGDKESNSVTVDDYIPSCNPEMIVHGYNHIYADPSNEDMAVVKDQHRVACEGVQFTLKKDNGDVVGTGIVNSAGIASCPLNSLNVGTHLIRCSVPSKNSGLLPYTVIKANTSLVISVPALVYSDNFRVTGVLINQWGNPIVDATVRLKWTVGNNEYSATETTNASGEVTFATQAPTSITDYSFQLEFDGNANYNSSNSSVVEKTVGKETSVLNVTTPVSHQNIIQGDTIHLEGTLFDNDGEIIPNSKVRVSCVGTSSLIYDNDNVPVGSDGSFSVDFTNPFSVGSSNPIRVIYYGDNYYTDSTKLLYIDCIPNYDDMSLGLSAGSQILSYADEQQTPNSQYATVTAQLLDGQSSALISGVPVVFGAYQDDVLITGSEQTVNTDSNGQASYTYHSQGLGDVVVKAVPDNRTLVSKTFSIRDAIKYIDTYSKTFSGGSSQYQSVYDLGSHSDCVITGKIKSSLGSGFGVHFNKFNSDSETIRCGASLNGISHIYPFGTVYTGSSVSANTDYSFEISCNGTNYDVKFNNDEKTGSNSVVSQLRYIVLQAWQSSGQTVTLTDLTIMPL